MHIHAKGAIKMKKSLFNRIISLTLFSLLPAIMIVTPLFLSTSCSDSERRMSNGDAMSTVLINLGTPSHSKSGPMAASAPSNIISVTVTVTGPGMPPMSSTYNAVSGTIDLSVPSGPSRIFAVVVMTTDSVYSGKAIASLPAGATVSVPVVMEYGALTGGTIDNPLFLPAGFAVYPGSVGKGKTYYYTDPGTHAFLELAISGLTDDADLISYSDDATYSAMTYPQFGQTYCGRNKDESISTSGGGGPYYFVVDGSHTKLGARFLIKCLAHDGIVVGPSNVGTMLEPNIVPVGLPYNTRVAWDSILLINADFYSSIVKPGTQYWVNTYPYEPTNLTTIYMGPLFTNPLPGTNTFTAPGSLACYGITNVSFANTFTLEVVASEGTRMNPIDLYPDEEFMAGRANYCMVGGGYGSSYYRFPISGIYFSSYIIRVSSILGGVGMYVYNGPSFTEMDQINASNNSGTTDEVVGVILSDFPDGYVYVEVYDDNGSGSTFVLDVMAQGG